MSVEVFTVCSIKQDKKSKREKEERMQLEGTLKAVVLLKIAALNTLHHINVNKQPDLSKKVTENTALMSFFFHIQNKFQHR